jgi:hypothetical protein
VIGLPEEPGPCSHGCKPRARDYLLTVGVTCMENDGTGLGYQPYQWGVVEFWNRNAQTFHRATDAISYGMSLLGCTVEQVLDHTYAWGLVDAAYNKARITGFTIQPVVREANGTDVSDESDAFVPFGAICKEWIRVGLAMKPVMA